MTKETQPIHIRRASIDDVQLLFDWRNDPETRRQSGTTGELEWDGHVAWLEKALANPQRILCIAENDAGTPIGTVRADLREDGFAEISYTIAPQWRGKGLSKLMVLQFVRQELKNRPLAAQIKEGHKPSESVALALGLKPVVRMPSHDSAGSRALVEWR